jgi:hypothetical protein
MVYKTPVAAITSAVAVAILVATPGIIVSSQIAFGIAGGTSPGTSNVGGNGMPATQPLKGGGSGPANGQGVCYGQGADTLVPGQPSGNTQIPNQGSIASHEQHAIRDANCPASPGAASGH